MSETTGFDALCHVPADWTVAYLYDGTPYITHPHHERARVWIRGEWHEMIPPRMKWEGMKWECQDPIDPDRLPRRINDNRPGLHENS